MDQVVMFVVLVIVIVVAVPVFVSVLNAISVFVHVQVRVVRLLIALVAHDRSFDARRELTGSPSGEARRGRPSGNEAPSPATGDDLILEPASAPFLKRR
jgi:hypothetical protein